MPRFRVQYVDAKGAPRVEWIEGPTARWAFVHFEQAGARNVSVMEDHLAIDGRDLGAEAAYFRQQATRAPAASPPAEAHSVAEFIDARLALPGPKKPLKPLAAARGWLWPAAVFAFMAWSDRPRPGSGSEPVAFRIFSLLAVSVLVFGALSVSPMWLDQRVRHARAWRDWPTVLRLTRIAFWNPLIRSRPALQYGFGTLRAAALAGTGRMDEALSLLDRVARLNRQPESVIDSAKGTLYLAVNRYDEGIACRQRAAADPTRPGMKVDLAIALLEHRRDVEGAREQLAKVQVPPTSLVEAAFRSLASGLLDVEAGRPSDAVAAFTRARRAFEREAAWTSLEGLMLWTDPFLRLALAQAGESAQARAMLPRVTRYLTTVGRPNWLERCREAVQGAS